MFNNAIEFIKKNPTGSAWVISAVLFGFLFSGGAPFSVLTALAGALVAAVVSVYMAFYVFAYPVEPIRDYVKRCVPMLAVCVLVILSLVFKWHIPNFITNGVQAGVLSMWVAALFSSARSR